MKTISKIIFAVLMLITVSGSLKAQYVSNYAGKFNGTNSFISYSSASENDMRNGYTIEAWVYYKHVQGTHKLIFGDTAGVMLSINNNGSVSFRFNTTATANLDPFPVEKWTHLAVTYDGVNAKVYYDGVLKNTVISPGVIPAPSPIAYVGGMWYQGNVYNSFNGMLDDFRIWTKVRTIHEINRDMYLSLAVPVAGGVYSNLAVSYRFDVPGGSVVYDEAGTHPAYGNTFNVTFENYNTTPAEYSTFNSSLILEGNTSYCTAPPYRDFNVSSAVTMEAWAKVDVQGPRNPEQEIAARSNGINSYSYRMFIKNDTTAVFMVNAGSDYSVESRIQDPFMWNHIAGTYDAQTGEMKLYINGELAKTKLNTPAAIQDVQSDSLYIGSAGMSSLGSTLFKGQLDEIRIWADKNRSASQIKSYLNTGISYKNDPFFKDVVVFGFDGRADNATKSVNAAPFTALTFNGLAYMRSSRYNAPLYSASPLLWEAPGNFIDATWNVSQKPLTLPSNGTLTDSIYYATNGSVQDPKVMVLLNSANIHRVKVKLTAPDGTSIQLTPEQELSTVKSDMMTIFSDNASRVIEYNETSMAPFSPSFKPYQQLSALNGVNRKGWWKITIQVADAGSEGKLIKWGIQNSILTGTDPVTYAPDSYKLEQNFPNPFNPSTTISFNIGRAGFTTLKVYDILGKEVASLVNGDLNAGNHSINFNASALPSGVYFYKLDTDGFTDVKKMSLIK